MRMTPKARHQKSKARINQFEELLSDNARHRRDKLEIAIPSGPRLGDIVVEARGLSKGFDDNLLIDGLDFSLPRGGIVGIIGANGAGKTTLFRMIAGLDTPDSGKLTVGETVQLAHVDQSREDLDADKTVWDEIAAGQEFIEVGRRKMNSRAYVSSFMFKGQDQQKK